MRRNRQAFTLIEMSIAVCIMVMLLAVAVPSLAGVMRDRRLQRSLDEMNKLVSTAQERSVTERRTYLISWQKDQVVLWPEAVSDKEERVPVAAVHCAKGDAFILKLNAALVDKPPGDWAFWPSGTCEPAMVAFAGRDGSWTARYSPLTARAEIASYAAR